VRQIGSPRAKIDIQRFKGLGEMMPKTLFKTTLDPDRRKLLQVRVPDEFRLETEKLIGELMGRDASARYRFIVDAPTKSKSSTSKPPLRGPCTKRRGDAQRLGRSRKGDPAKRCTR
jgi:DNA gyrase/topoisomerase IV subunit B